ncbi:SPJ_0845 family protein [Streptococcus pluranimalium]
MAISYKKEDQLESMFESA